MMLMLLTGCVLGSGGSVERREKSIDEIRGKKRQERESFTRQSFVVFLQIENCNN